ncbi:hypothetical protein SLEP1_g31802 [Rubroshorea leprosula]|uniref:CW-type domain-containing protein n=1 Tax=Rubroshorea leprosula TaxID=152421 RepID=A0AAV5KBB1_9ROSI|nr:hypothetical protein SLEP1_g31802 [Rubroshorea leprosula]
MLGFSEFEGIPAFLSSYSFKHFTVLMKDEKIICLTRCLEPPIGLPERWSILNIVPRARIHIPHGLPHCELLPAPRFHYEQREWRRFLDFLHCRDMVAILKHECFEFFILPPDTVSSSAHIKVAYKMGKGCYAPMHVGGHHAPKLEFETYTDPQHHAVKQERPLEKNYVRADPSYLQTLGQAHSGWIFGAVAELVDNARDAKAKRLDISIDIIYSKRAGKHIPMLSVIDDGHGMSHQDIVRMTCFGHKQGGIDDPDRLGKFGIGFKTGSMRLGKDALVLTQTANSRSIAFLSQSLNEGKDNLEIPIVSYRREGQYMEVDTSVHSETLAKYNLKAIKEFSPFDKYLIGEKTGLFHGRCTGTQIYIWHLEEWTSDYCLEWQCGLNGGSTFHQGDILIRSRRIRSRPGQISQKVPLDYSLRVYLEVIFLVPRMKIYVQGSLVKSRPLQKSLNKTSIETGNIMGKPLHLTLGFCQLEWEQANCGIFLYWHGRLIEAYKRVGGMIHNGEIGRGVIGVVDVTDLMNAGNGRVWVHNNKQGFQDCEAYAQLELWLGRKVDEYWDQNFDKLQLTKNAAVYKPDHEWVQCDKCRKWRVLSADFDSKSLPSQWFCYMKPFSQSCDIPEEKLEYEVITLSTKRSGCEDKEKLPQCKDDFYDASVKPKGKPGIVAVGAKRTRSEYHRACKK